MATKRLIKLPSTEMGKTATSDRYISNHFTDTTLLFSHIIHKQESGEIPERNLTGLIRTNLRVAYV